VATYDPYKLIEQARSLLDASDLDPVIVSEKDALIGACQLIRALGAFPAMDPLDFYARGDRNSWEETDDRNAATFPESPL
jgi:hypothetical protein